MPSVISNQHFMHYFFILFILLVFYLNLIMIITIMINKGHFTNNIFKTIQFAIYRRTEQRNCHCAVIFWVTSYCNGWLQLKAIPSVKNYFYMSVPKYTIITLLLITYHCFELEFGVLYT